MVFTLLLSAHVAALGVLFLLYANGLTRRAAEVEALFKRRLQAGLILEMIDSTRDRRLSEFDHDRYFVRTMLPLMFRETWRLADGSSDPLSRLLILLFCLMWASVWLKALLAPRKEDLRILIGAEMLILRRVAT